MIKQALLTIAILAVVAGIVALFVIFPEVMVSGLLIILLTGLVGYFIWLTWNIAGDII